MKKILLLCFLVPLFFINSIAEAEEINVNSVDSVSQSISFNDSNTVVSDVLTFDELVQEIAKDQNISISQASDSIVANSSSKNLRAARVATYRTLSKQFNVTNGYQPTMRFYCETSESGWFRAIKKILEVNMIRGYQGVSKQFSGSVYVKLEHANKIFFIVNGDFYNNGTTTVNAGINLGVGASASVKFGVSYASNHFKYRYVESSVTF